MKRVFLNLDTVDTLDQIIFLLCVSVLCIVGYLASFLACMGYMPVALPQLGQLKYLQRLPALLPLSPAWLGPTDTKLWKVRCLQSSACCPDFMDSYRVFHMCFLFTAAININILICNSGYSLAAKINGGEKRKNILLRYCSALNYMLLRCQ